MTSASFTKRAALMACAAATLAVAGLGFAGTASARDNVQFSVGIGVPGVQVGVSNAYPVYQPVYRPVYQQPVYQQPVYVQPAPVYVQPRAVYYPQPVYYAPAPAFRPHRHKPQYVYGPGHRRGPPPGFYRR